MDTTHRQAALDQVALLMADAIADKRTRARALKADSALVFGDVYRDAQGVVWCKSDSQRGVIYRVEAGRCTCQARVTCWHRMARRALCLYERALWELSQPDDAPPAPKPPTIRASMRSLELHLRRNNARPVGVAIH